MLTRVTTGITCTRTRPQYIHIQSTSSSFQCLTKTFRTPTGLRITQRLKPKPNLVNFPRAGARSPHSFAFDHRQNHTSIPTPIPTPTLIHDDVNSNITITSHTTMSSSAPDLSASSTDPDPQTNTGLKRSLPLDEGTGAGGGIASSSGVESEQVKRARFDDHEGSGEPMIVDSEFPAAGTSNPAEEGGESDSDVIITGTEQTEKEKEKGKGKAKGKGRRRRADDWNKNKNKNKNKEKGGGEGEEGKSSNKRNRGRAPPPSRPGTGLTRNEEDALKKDMGEGGAESEGEEKVKSVRYPKRQCALLLGFCGSGYSGMQIQPDHTRTIEGVLFNALVRAGAVSQDNADNPTKVNLARAARTDAGVHAAGNVVSLKMITKPPGVKDLVERINEELPPEIRVWGYARTQNSFNARLVCESRKYTYFFPTYLLIPPKPGSGMHRVWSELASVFPPSTTTSPESSSEDTSITRTPTAPSLSYEFWESHPEESTKEEDMARKRAWRIAPSQVSNLREAASKYLGTHNFHNFTVGREFKDRSNNRFMRKIEVSDPVVYGETEWISVLFHGQSFMLHQRKMMAALVLSCRMGTPSKVIDELYKEREVFVPKMPSLGLLLEEPLFDSYNQRMGAINAKLTPSDPEYRPLIDFDIHREKIDAFKDEFIYQNMRKVEDRDGLFDAWVRYIDAYAGSDLSYLNPSGVVPDAAVVKRGEKRTNPFKEKRVFDTTSFPEKGIKQRLEGAVDAEGSEDEEEEVLDKRHLAETEG